MKHIHEKSVSKAQQRLMGQAWALRKGEIKSSDIDPAYLDEIKKIAFGDMTDKELLKFAETEIAELPDHVSDGSEKPKDANFETKQIPSNYIGAVPGGDSQLKVVPYFNWNSGQGKKWWTSTGNKAPKKLRFIKEFDDFKNDAGELDEDISYIGNKIDILLDYLKEKIEPSTFLDIYEIILHMVNDGMFKSYAEMFSRISKLLSPEQISAIPQEIKP